MGRSKKPRKTYRPKNVRINAHMSVIERSKILRSEVTDEFSNELEMAALLALDSICRGHGNKENWDVLANCLNHGWLCAKAGLGSEARDAFNQAHEAMRRMVPEYHKTGKLMFQSKTDQNIIESAVGLWIEQLKIITIGELSAAMQVVEENYWKHREA